MTADERRQQVSEYLARKGFADLGTLVSELGVSESTVRRDLSLLEEEGIVRRTHGGAVFVSDRFSVLNYSARESAAVSEKLAIGKAVADLIEDGETVLLDGGTTTFQVARHLLLRSLQVVTNSLPIANLLGSAANVELTFVGGYIYPRTGVALGPVAVQALKSLHVSKCIMGIAGLTDEGLYNANVLMVEAEQQMIDCADELIIAADRSKFGKRALARLSDWDVVDRVVSDERLESRWQEVVRQAGAELILAAPEALTGAAARSSDGEVRPG